MLTADGRVFTSSYDGVGRLTSLLNDFAETTNYTYQANGWLQTRTDVTPGVTTTYTRDVQGRLTSLVSKKGTTTLSSFTVPTTGGYDGMGNRLSVTASVPGAPAGYSGTATYQYDYAQTANPQLNRSQLTGETSTRITGSGSYAYDGGIGNGVGNPTSFKGTVNSFNSDNQQTGSTYDGNGSPTTYRTKTLTFDPENRMSGYNGSTQTNVYSGDGLRATKAGTRAGKYLYDGDEPVIEFTASNEVSNTFGPDGLVSRHVLGGVTTFYTFDERGNVSQRLTNTGSISSTDAYDAYGTRSSTVSAQPDPWGYEAEVGYYTDTETGLILCTHRFYDPATGLFITRDPIGYDGGINLYGYVGNDPGNEDDANGTTRTPIPGTGGKWCFDDSIALACIKRIQKNHPVKLDIMECWGYKAWIENGLECAEQVFLSGNPSIESYITCLAGKIAECLTHKGLIVGTARLIACVKAGVISCSAPPGPNPGPPGRGVTNPMRRKNPGEGCTRPKS